MSEAKENKYVIIRSMSCGNESIGEMWNETKIFDGNSTLDEVMKWAMCYKIFKGSLEDHSKRHIIITKPHEDNNE